MDKEAIATRQFMLEGGEAARGLLEAQAKAFRAQAAAMEAISAAFGRLLEQLAGPDEQPQ